jgi:N-acylglucosamine 2-epimerase
MRENAGKGSGPGLDGKKIKELSRFYRKHLLEDVMPFWEVRTEDRDHGGYITCFDRTGQMTDATKYIWFQGRQLWMFSALCNRVEKRREWLDLAEAGRDFIVKHAYAGSGRWNYQLDRTGKVEKGTISIYTDHFVLSALSENAVATGSDRDRALIRDTYETMEKNVYDPDFKDIFHGRWDPRFKRHGIYMISLHVAGCATPVLGENKTRPLIDHCLEQILYTFAKDDRELLYESVSRNGEIVDDDPEGRVINPGHTMESMWFCIEEGKKIGNSDAVERAIRIIDWAYRSGYDRDHGGILSFLDASGARPSQKDWHRETDTVWHDKVWWVHSEALYALACAAVQTGNAGWLTRFEDLHEWCQAHFFDPEYGEWYATLFRDGTPKLTDKGTVWKAAYHLPRALMLIMLLFERYAES